MPREALHFISPNFTHEKLEPPFYKDVVDVFEDRMVNWLLVPAKQLLKVKHGSVAAVALGTNYIEGIEIYVSGQDSKGRSKEFFRRGFRRIFATTTEPAHIQDALANGLYDLLRCGFAHDSMFRSGIYFGTVRKEAFTISWPKKGGQFDANGKLDFAFINPVRFIEGIEHHLRSYIKELRSKNAQQSKTNFLAAVGLKWRLGEPGPVVAMTEAAFLSGAPPSTI